MITVPPGVYEDIEYQVEVQSNGTDAALQLNGSYTNSNGLATPVVFKVNTALEIESEQANVELCTMLGYSKQAYYKGLHYQQQQAFDECLVVGLIEHKRQIWKRGSGRNLWKSL